MCVFVCSTSVKTSTQAWVFTLEVPISSWRWQESMSWLSSNELLQPNLSATISLCLTLFFFPPVLLQSARFSIIRFLAPFLPARCLFPLSFFLYCPPYPLLPPFFLPLLLLCHFVWEPSCLIIALRFQQTSSFPFLPLYFTLCALSHPPSPLFSLSPFHLFSSYLPSCCFPVYFLNNFSQWPKNDFILMQ